MWNVACEVNGQENPEVVECTNPDSEVNRFRFKDSNAHIVVTYNGHTRRVYKNGEITKDVLEYPEPLKAVEDYADSLAFMAYVGNRKDYLDQVSGTTKKQRARLVERRHKAALKEQPKRKAA